MSIDGVKKWAGVLWLACLMGSCNEHEPVTDYSLRVGNIYLEDGRVVPPSVFDEQDVQAVGVVVQVGTPQDDYRALVVGLEEWESAACNRNVVLRGVRMGVDDMEGKSNTAAMLEAVYESVEHVEGNQEHSVLHCPAAESIKRYHRKDGSWHLPACGELLALSRHRQQVARSMEQVHGKPLTADWYLSSTQDGTNESTQRLFMLNVSLTEGRVISSEKTSVKRVRPFLILQ